MTRPLAVTCGDPAGIGPDITLAGWMRRRELELPPFYVLADPAALAARASELGFDIPMCVTPPENALSRFGNALPIVEIGAELRSRAGAPDAAGARVAVAAINQGAAQVMSGQASALVTNPIAKSALYQVGFEGPGQTEHLAKLAQEHTGRSARAVMMLWSEQLAVVPVTIHVPLARVSKLITVDLIVETGRVVASDLSSRFGIAHPRLAVSALNPHAGEDGTIGSEERTIIAPAIARLREEGIDVRGPLAADSMFHAAARKSYDAALAMYHDQALIPIKTIAFETAVNVTLGLPFVRTSPDHGTAFDIAGTGRADPSSFIAALRLARRLSAAVPAASPA